MNRSIQINFLLIAITQGIHSIEEYTGHLWVVFPPARFLSGLVSTDLRKGFIIINISLFIVLVLVWLSTYSKTSSTKGLLWLWAIMETINGLGHIIWAIIERSYVAGLATAPVLLFLAIYLMRSLIKVNKQTTTS
jgi:hypothetical protein